jgi:hypothetical protein
MTTPYSGATSVGAQTPTAGPVSGGNYAVGPDATPHSGNLGTPTTATGQPDIEKVSVGQLIGEVTKDLSTLMRQELDLAKAEMKVEAKRAGQGAGAFGAAGFAGYMAIFFLSIALWWALSHLVGHSWSALIVAIIWGVIGAVAYSVGRKKFREFNPKPERTMETLQQVPSALKPN